MLEKSSVVEAVDFHRGTGSCWSSTWTCSYRFC